MAVLMIRNLPDEMRDRLRVRAAKSGSARSFLPLGLSLGDRTCLALALSRKIPAYTADRMWAKLDIDIEIRIIG